MTSPRPCQATAATAPTGWPSKHNGPSLLPTRALSIASQRIHIRELRNPTANGTSVVPMNRRTRSRRSLVDHLLATPAPQVSRRRRESMAECSPAELIIRCWTAFAQCCVPNTRGLPGYLPTHARWRPLDGCNPVARVSFLLSSSGRGPRRTTRRVAEIAVLLPLRIQTTLRRVASAATADLSASSQRWVWSTCFHPSEYRCRFRLK